MTQHDGVIANQGFSAFRADLNDLAQAILSTHSGTSAPSGIVAGQFWIDTDTPSATVRTLFHYDGTDSIGIMQLDYTNNYIAKLGIGIVPSGMAAGTLLHLKTASSSQTADTSADEFVIEVAGSAGGMSVLGTDGTALSLFLGQSGSVTGAQIVWDGDAETNGTLKLIANKTSSQILVAPNGNTESARFAGLKFLVGDTSDANITQGVTVHSGANNYGVARKSTGTAHGVTGEAETDTHALYGPLDPASGGSVEFCFRESGNAVAWRVVAFSDAPSTTMSTAAVPAAQIQHRSFSGAGAANVAANAIAFGVSSRRSGNDDSVFLVDEDGEFAGDIGEIAAFDDEDDTGLVALDNDVMQRARGDVVPSGEFFASLYRLSQKKLYGFVGPRQWAAGVRPMKVYSTTIRLLEGEAVQRANREAIYVQATEEMLPGFMARCEALAAGRNVGRLPAPINL